MGDIVEQAEAHGLIAFGVVARWANGAESIAQPARMDFINGCNHGSRRTQSGLERPGRHHRIAIDVDKPVLPSPRRINVCDGIYQRATMRLPEDVVRDAGRFQPNKRLESLRFEAAQEGPQTIRRLGMAAWRSVTQACRVRDQSCAHDFAVQLEDR
jgi:hypothetical protein